MQKNKSRWIFYLFSLFIIIYLLPGIYGHTPWKQDENYSFGIIQTMYETGNWLVPINAGEPFMEKPPLYYWTAAITAHLLHGLLPLHDAARTATLFYSTMGLCFFILLAKRVFQSNRITDPLIWIALIFYISAPGFLRHSHDMFTDVALTAGTIIGLYGLIGLIIQQKIITSTLWLCLGTVITMLSKGIFIPGLLWIVLCLSPLMFNTCRNKRFLYHAIWAAFGSLVLILPWPVTLYLHEPQLFIVWFWENNIGRFLGFSVDRLGARASFFRIPEAIALFAFPCGLLSCFYFFRHPIKCLTNDKEFALITFTVLGIIFLQISSTSRALYLLPFIAPMAILAVRVFISFKPWIFPIIKNFSVVLWSTVIVLIWSIYLLKIFDSNNPLLSKFDRFLPISYELKIDIIPLLFSVLITFIWLCRKRITQTLEPALHAAMAWGIGITVSWGLIFSLLVGWIDYTKGYQNVFTDLKTQLNGAWQPSDCMASYSVDESEAPMLYYYTQIMHMRQHELIKPEHCRWLIVLSNHINPAPEGMELYWQGNRAGETKNNLFVYKTLTP